MPIVELKIKKGGKIESDFLGFIGDDCDLAEEEIRQRLKGLKIETEAETRKDDNFDEEEEEEYA